MRASDEKLGTALYEIGLYELAANAKRGAYNEFFGQSATPMLDLHADLRNAAEHTDSPERRGQINALLARAEHGEFDAPREEFEEWRSSAEGRAVLREIVDE